MKLLRFKAKKVYGYLKFDIKFDDKLSFLVGGNGSGKTTILKLIQAVLTPNLGDIYLIPFTEIELEIQNSSKNYEIKVLPKPITVSYTLELKYPGYLNKNNEIVENAGDVTVPEGTKVTLAGYGLIKTDGVNTESDDRLRKVQVEIAGNFGKHEILLD